ncbi:MAG: ABC transporter permease [Terriglobales bacterium]
MGSELRYALRLLRRAPGFAAVAILTLGLGIGANTAMFTIVDAVLMRPLPYPHASRIVQVRKSYHGGGSQTSTSVPNYLDLSHSPAFQSIAAYDPIATGFSLVGQGVPQRFAGLHVTSGFFRTLGVQPVLGRDFAPDEDQPGHAPVAIITHSLWEGEFGGRPDVIGRAETFNGVAYTVIGVLPGSFRFSPRADVFAPLDLQQATTYTDRQANVYEVIARLAPGVSLRQAEAQVTLLANRLSRQYAADRNSGILLRPLREELSGPARPALLILLGAVGLVLLIACANVANLLLARAAGRRQELALRMALGAAPGRIARQLLTESLLLAFLGGAAGLLLAYWAVPALVALGPASLPQVTAIGISGPVLLFTVGLCIATGVIFGSAPAWQAARPDMNAVLKEGGTRASGGRGRRRLRSALVVSEMAFALVLLTGAGLLITSWARLEAVPPGFRPSHVLTLRMALPPSQFANTVAVANFDRALLPRLDRLPGVRAAAISDDLPLEGMDADLPFEVMGRPAPARNNVPDGFYHVVAGRLFAALGMPLLRGRGFTAADTAGSPPVVIINQAAAERYWPHQNPIGQAIWIGKPIMGPALTDPAPRTIVGVVGNVHENSLGNRHIRDALYIPAAQVPDALMALFVKLLPPAVVVRTTGDPGALTAAVERQVWAVNPAVPLYQQQTLEQIVTQSAGPQRFSATLLGIFAALALVLAAVGIYGVMAYSVAQRQREIGVRMALGAGRSQVLRMVVGDGLRLALIGIAIGWGAGLALTRLLASLLFGVRSWDPAIFIATGVALVALAVLASLVPARRAAGVDPMLALRNE